MVALITAVILIAVGVNAINGVVTVEKKESSFKLTDFDYVIKLPWRAQIDELVENEAVEDIFPCTELSALVRTEDNHVTDIKLLASDRMDCFSIGLFNDKTLVAGEYREDGMMLDETAAEKLHVSVGDSVQFNFIGTPLTYTVCAIYRASTYRTLEDGIGVIAMTDAMKAIYGKEPAYSFCFVDASDKVACGTLLSSYIPMGLIKTEAEFTEEYKTKYEKTPGLTDAEWDARIAELYVSYLTDEIRNMATLDLTAYVQDKAVMMEDVQDRLETTKNDVDMLTVGIAIAAAVAYSAMAVVILFRFSGDDVLLAKQGAEKKHIKQRKLVLYTAAPVLVTLVAFSALYAYADMKGFEEASLGVIALCSLPVLVSVPVSFVAITKYVDRVFGKREREDDENGGFMMHIEEGEQNDTAGVTPDTNGEANSANGDTNGNTPENANELPVMNIIFERIDNVADAESEPKAEEPAAESTEEPKAEEPAAEPTEEPKAEPTEEPKVEPVAEELDIGIDYVPETKKPEIVVTDDEIG